MAQIFNSRAEAEDYARRTGGTVRPAANAGGGVHAPQQRYIRRLGRAARANPNDYWANVAFQKAQRDFWNPYGEYRQMRQAEERKEKEQAVAMLGYMAELGMPNIENIAKGVFAKYYPEYTEFSGEAGEGTPSEYSLFRQRQQAALQAMLSGEQEMERSPQQQAEMLREQSRLANMSEDQYSTYSAPVTMGERIGLAKEEVEGLPEWQKALSGYAAAMVPATGGTSMIFNPAMWKALGGLDEEELRRRRLAGGESASTSRPEWSMYR